VPLPVMLLSLSLRIFDFFGWRQSMQTGKEMVHRYDVGHDSSTLGFKVLCSKRR